jgi:hypothetical protein
VEIPDCVGQKRAEALALLAARAALFSRQGSVQESWRFYHGQRRGPYFRLVWRQGGKQQSLYLGADRALAEEVRRALGELQAPLREQRALDRLRTLARAALKQHKRDLDRELRRRGAYLKGYEIRGRRRGAGPGPAPAGAGPGRAKEETRGGP